MQEDIENKTVSMAVSGSKFTGRMLKDAITKLLAHQKNPKVAKDVTPHGKQTVRQLAAQNQGMTSIKIRQQPDGRHDRRRCRCGFPGAGEVRNS